MSAAHRNLLVTCGGKWVGMVLQLRQAMQRSACFKDGRVIVASSEDLTPAGCFADESVVVPPIRHPIYIDRLLELCRDRGIGVVVPLIDLDVERLSALRTAFKAIGVSVVCPEPDVVELCMDKLAFARFAEAEGLPHPETCEVDGVGAMPFPLFYKRRRGFGSLGAGICESHNDIARLGIEAKDMIFQPVVQAREITVDAYVPRQGECNLCVPRMRDKVVAGESFKTHTIRHPGAMSLALRTISALAARGFRGPLNVQMFDTQPPCLIEVNTRLGSASVLSNVATGGRYFDMVLQEASGDAVAPEMQEYRVGAALSRFLGDVFHDGDQVLEIHPG